MSDSYRVFTADPVTPITPAGWGDIGDGSGNADNWNGWLTGHSKAFDAGVQNLKKALDKAFTDLSGAPDSPMALAAYQSALAQYNMYRMLQSNSVKSIGDQSKSVIRNLA